MPKFTSISYKNLSSTGNNFIKIQLDRSSSTLIGGANGAGKTTLGFALSYALFGKFPSGANLQAAINSVNGKNLLVKLDFSERGSDYHVVRGEKPKKFEIYKDGNLIDQNANARDYQKILELIIGMDYKVFTQVVLLNKEKYVPFMEMGAADRRKIVEDILDIRIFSEMNDVCKKRIKENDREMSNTEHKIDIKNAGIAGQQKLINEIQDSLNESQEKSKVEIESNQKLSQKYKNMKFKLIDQINQIDISGQAKAKKRKSDFEKLAVQFESQINMAKKNAAFFEDNDHCPTCEQSISEDKKSEKKEECDHKVSEVQSTVSEMMDELQKTIAEVEEYEKLEEKRRKLRIEVDQLDFKIREVESAIKRLQKASENDSSADKLETAISYYNDIEKEIESLRNDLEKLIKKDEDLKKLRGMLKDDGIKADIIKEYMALMNKKINEYLQAMNLYINMVLDENFKESFKAMHKEKFTMSNLSTGQKTRVNLAIWLALLEISSIKNSVVSNVLFLDEILEALDAEGVKDTTNLFKEKLNDKNIFVVTQRFDEFQDLFRNQIQFKLNQGFTEIV